MHHEDPNVASLSLDVTALSVDGSTEPPTEFRIFTAGKVDTWKGAFQFDQRAAEDVMAAYAEHGTDLPIDYDHAMFDSYTSPQDRVAAGWFGLELRGGELWASNVRWTPKADAALRAREWRFISPTLTHETETPFRVKRLFNVALTNVPATKQLRPLVASQRGGGTSDNHTEARAMTALLTALSAKDEGEALASVQRLKDAVGALTALTGKPTLGEALAVCSAWKDGAARVGEIEAQLAADRKRAADAKALSEIDAAIGAKRLAPATKPVAEKLYADHGAPALEAFLSALPQIVAHEPVTPPAEAGAVTLSAEDLEVAVSLGITPAQALANKKLSLAHQIGGAA
jgi:phage I-like protein